MTVPRLITGEDLGDLADGAVILGTGGGGDPYIGRLMAEEAIRRHGPVHLVAPSELDDDALVLPVGMMGAPTVMLEKLPSGREVMDAICTMEEHLGRSAQAVMTTEAGGLNSTIALIVAASRGVPILDADMVGRAFPELQMCTPSLHGTPATPLALVDDKGNRAIIHAVSNRWAERLARAATVEMGCWAMVSLYPLTGRQAKTQTIHGTLSLLMRIGRSIRVSMSDHEDPITAVLAATSGYKIWSGKICDVSRRTVGGFARGEVTIDGLGEWQGDRLRIAFQNEFLIARSTKATLATTPDLITILDAETAEPITTETLRYGFRVVVIAIPGNPAWRTPAGLEVVGPAYFGYDEVYSPVEVRLSAVA